MLRELNEANRPLTILPHDSQALDRYGRIINGIDCSDMIDPSTESALPENPAYIRDLEELRKLNSFDEISREVYGGRMALQAGICFGYNDRMNGMEYHEGSEVIVAITDCVLILGRCEDIHNDSWDSSLAECFYLPEGTVMELYSNTLHLAPCRTTDSPFCTVIILPEGTNRPLEKSEKPGETTYFMENKWLICHRESPAVQRGAHVGIEGENIRIKTV
ncbi:DUF4867 family protein [Spirochaeta isovalerica]|uniref:DUF4867 domain-containing protein n=1 Tax=Spirochaeta isovalerica TaxID=150 RepID=A0A841RHM9_9SPIO|nr:DUF4867 family protein [Spirochaeta isovalerica]MBB6482520.1 hypothetical protein [Spirochaeta isovalerica]